MPKEFNFIQTFDLYVKTNYILKQNEHGFILPLMNFMQYYIYKNIENKRFSPTNTMLELYNKLTA